MSLVWIGFAALLAGAGVSDALTYRIPNWISVALALLFVLAAGLRGAPFLPLWPNVAAAGIVLGIGYLLFRFTKMGAGDAKLAAAATLWTGVGGLYPFFVALAVSMAALVIALLAFRAIYARSGLQPRARALQRGAPAPLGVAIAAAALAASGHFDSTLWRLNIG